MVALPLALAFGVASGLGPVAGLYGAIATGIVAAIFGGTPVQITGPTGPMTLVVAGVLAANLLPSGAVNLPVVVGIFVLAGLVQIALGLFRIGSYIRYVLTQLSAAGVRVLVVGVSVAHLDLLEKLQVVPTVVPTSDIFSDFDALKKALPGIIGKIQAELAVG